MPFIKIPDSALPGFLSISEESTENIEQLAAFLNDMPVGMSMDNVNEHVSANLKIEHSRSIIQTLLSMSDLIQSHKGERESLAADLALSFKLAIEEDDDENSFSYEEENKLREHLSIILKSCRNFLLTLKSIDLARVDDLIYQESMIVTDIRVLFDDDLESSNRYGVMIHRLKIEHSKSGRRSESVFSLDLQDLNELKGKIERAIKKEQLLKQDYDSTIHFIDVSAIL